MLIKKGGHNTRNGTSNQLAPGGYGGGQFPPASPSRQFPPPSPSRSFGFPPASPSRGFGGFPPPASQPRPDAGQASRLDALEQRLAAMENNSRSMINQFTQIQQDTQVSLRRDAHAVSEQRESRGRLEMALRGTQERLAGLEHRVARSSTAMRDTQSAVQSLSVQTNNLRNALESRGQSTGEMAAERLEMTRQEVMNLQHHQDASRQATNALREDIQNMRMKAETLQGDLMALAQSSRLQQEMFEEDTRRTIRGGGGSGNGGIGTTAAAAVEGKVMRLQQNLLDVESRMAHEGKSAEMLQMQQNKKINDLVSELGECKRYSEDDIRDLQRKAGSVTGATDTEKQRLQRAIDEVREKMDARLRPSRGSTSNGRAEDELVAKLKEMESELQHEVSARTEREVALKTEVERSLADIKAYTDEGFSSVRKGTETEHDQTKRRFKELTEALNLLEDSRDHDTEDIQKKLEKLKDERRKLDREMDDRLDDIGDRLRIAMASLQAAHADLPPGQTAPPGLSMEEIERLQNMNSEGAREQLTRALAETELKLTELNTRVEQQDEVIENKLRTLERSDGNDMGVMGDEVSQKLDTVEFQQQRLKRQVGIVEDNIKESPSELAEVRQKLQEDERRLNDAIEREARERREQIEELGRSRKHDDSAQDASRRLQQEVDETQTSVTKLTEAMQVVKNTIGDKIKQGKRAREQDFIDLKRNIDRLNDQTRDLKDRIKHPNDYFD